MKTQLFSTRKSRLPFAVGCRCAALSLAIFVGYEMKSQAQNPVTWADGQADNLWSNGLNWTGGLPSGNNVTFGDAGKANQNVVNNIVNGNFTVNSLTYLHQGSTSGANYHTTQIDPGYTLTISGGNGTPTGVFTNAALVVGGYSGTDARITRVAFTGGGTLSVDSANRNIVIGNEKTTAGNSLATLDLSSLANFNASLGTTGEIRVGYGDRSAGELTLAASNLITSSAIFVGYTGGNVAGQKSILRLGASNVINTNKIEVGSGKANGLVEFASDLTDATVQIRGSNGTGRADLRVGYSALNTGVNATGEVDFRGGSVDALLGAVTIGYGPTGSGTGSVSGKMSYDAGPIDATTIILGQSTSTATSTNLVEGILNVGGGNLTAGSLIVGNNSAGGQNASGTVNLSGGTVSVSGAVILGQRIGSATGVNGTLNLTGGTFTANGGIHQGANNSGTSTIILDGGTLDLKSNTVNVDNFSARSGVLKNLGQLNSDAAVGVALTKTSSGTLILDGANTYTGATLVNAGLLRLNGSLANGNVSVSSGASFEMTSQATLNLNIFGAGSSDTFTLQSGGNALFAGTLQFNFTSTSDQNGAWSLFSGTNASLFAGLNQVVLSDGLGSISLVNNGSGLWLGMFNGQEASFDTSSGSLMVVPEPGSSMLLLGTFGIGVAALRWRRNRTKAPLINEETPA